VRAKIDGTQVTWYFADDSGGRDGVADRHLFFPSFPTALDREEA
jgi:hypothetical protein